MVKRFIYALIATALVIHIPIAVASYQFRGLWAFNDSYLLDADWYINSSHDLVINSIKFHIDFGASIDPKYPCKQLVGEGSLQECSLYVAVGGYAADQITTYGTKGFTAEEIINFLNRTGVVGQTWASGGLCFYMVANYKNSSRTSPIPGDCMSGAPNIPPSNGGGTVTQPPVCTATAHNISHGTLDPSTINGNTSTGSVDISCDKKADITIKALSYNPLTGLALKGTGSPLYTTIMLNGASAEKGAQGTANLNTTFKIISILKSDSPSGLSGGYSGNLLFTITYQ